MDELLESAELLAFTKTVDARSLSRAALELRVPRATVGRRLQRLEQRLGLRLLRRTTRSLVLTDAGEAFYRQARIALDAVRQAEQSVRRVDGGVRGELRVSAPPIGYPAFRALISEFTRRYPEVRLELQLSTQHVDLLRGGFDVAIRGTSTLEPGLVARVLTRSRLITVAAPSYLAHSAPLRTMRDLRQHACLLNFARGELPQTYWADRKGRKVQVAGALASNDIGLLAQAAVDGLGIAQLPEKLISVALASGALVRVLSGIMETDSVLAVAYPEREFLPPQVRAFVDAVSEWARSHGDDVLWPPGPQLPASASVAQRAGGKRTARPRRDRS